MLLVAVNERSSMEFIKKLCYCDSTGTEHYKGTDCELHIHIGIWWARFLVSSRWGLQCM